MGKEIIKEAKKNVEKVKVKLVKAHTHRGEDKKPGDTIEVRPDQEKWLKKHGVIE